MDGSEEPIRRVEALRSEGKISEQEAVRLIDAITQLASDTKSQRTKSNHAEASGTSRPAAKTRSRDGSSERAGQR